MTVPARMAAVRARLAALAAGADTPGLLSPARAAAVMEERARRLAPAVEPDLAGSLRDVARFTLAGERYGLEARYLREVVRPGDVTRIPGTPERLLGVTNLRGALLPVFDLRRLLDLPPADPTPQARVLVLGTEQAEVGVLVDTVEDMTRLRADDLHDVPAALSAAGAECLAGVTADALVMLDGERLLAHPRLCHAGSSGEPAGKRES